MFARPFYFEPPRTKLTRVALDALSPTSSEHMVHPSAMSRISIDESHRAFMRERFLLSDYVNSFD
jgi:hypothetical protein